MAEGGTAPRPFKDAFGKASGDAEECLCDPCKNGGKYVAVEGYCHLCQEYLCDICLGVHRNQKMTRGHTILDKYQMPGGHGPNTNRVLRVEVCKTHHTELVTFYCKAHDAPGCGVCMTLNHSTCIKSKIQDVSKGFQATREFKTVKQELDKFHKELELMGNEFVDNLKNLDTTFNTIQQQITSYRKQVNDYLDQIQNQITEEAANVKKAYETELKKLIADNESMLSEFEDIRQRIQNNSVININSVFVIAKQAKQSFLKAESKITKMKQSRRKLQKHYVFRPSIEIENLISAKPPLGQLLRIPYINTTVSYTGTIHVKTRTDKKDCWISACTLLAPDRIVVTDNFNDMIKLIDIRSDTVISSYRTSSRPSGLTAISADRVAVALPSETKIQLFNVTSTFTKHHEIQVAYACRGLAYKDGKFAVTSVNPGRAEILDIHGNVLHTIQPKQGNEDILWTPYYVVFGQDNDTVIVSDESTNKVSVITFNGQILHTYTHDTLKQPSGLVLTADGVLFVCSWNNDKIHAVTPDFNTSEIIINNDINVAKPGTITYCDINHRLWISNNVPGGEVMNNTIKVYDLNI